MKRYNESLEKYEKTAERYKTAKKTRASSIEITNARLAKKKAKSKLNKDYERLKQDKLADQGKELYSKGKTIRGNAKVTKILSRSGALSITAAAYLYKNGKTDGAVINALSAIGGLSLAASTVKSVSDSRMDKRLRAYYSHTSNY